MYHKSCRTHSMSSCLLCLCPAGGPQGCVEEWQESEWGNTASHDPGCGIRPHTHACTPLHPHVSHRCLSSIRSGCGVDVQTNVCWVVILWSDLCDEKIMSICWGNMWNLWHMRLTMVLLSLSFQTQGLGCQELCGGGRQLRKDWRLWLQSKFL